MMFLFKGFKAQ